MRAFFSLKLMCISAFTFVLILTFLYNFLTNIDHRLSMRKPLIKSLLFTRNISRHTTLSYYGGYGNISQCPPNIYRRDLTELLRKWRILAQANNITWVLFYGSLLGSLRNNDIIPYDSDIDVLVDVEDLPKLRRLESVRNFTNDDYKARLVLVPDDNTPVPLRRHITCEGEVVAEMSDQCSFTDPMGRLINGEFHIDLYEYHTRSTHIEDHSEKTLKRYRLDDFYPFRDCQFLGQTCKCPNNPLPLLMQYFRTSDLSPSKVCRGGKWV